MPPAGETADASQEPVSDMLQVMVIVRCVALEALAVMKGMMSKSAHSMAAAKSTEDYATVGERLHCLSPESGSNVKRGPVPNNLVTQSATRLSLGCGH